MTSKTTRFSTDMGSLAYQNVYDLLELNDSLAYSTDTPVKDMPVDVRDRFDHLIDTLCDTSDVVVEIITSWVAAAIVQSRDVSEAQHMDSLLGGKLESLGIIDDAVEIAQSKINTVSGIND